MTGGLVWIHYSTFNLNVGSFEMESSDLMSQFVQHKVGTTTQNQLYAQNIKLL